MSNLNDHSRHAYAWSEGYQGCDLGLKPKKYANEEAQALHDEGYAKRYEEEQKAKKGDKSEQ